MEKARIMNTKTTKRLLLTGALALSALAFSPLAAAQSWPAAKPIRIVIAFGPGSASDIIARLLGERLSRALGQSVIVDAKPGAAGQIAAEHVAGSPADGYTLFLTTNTTHSANPYLYKHLRYDPVKDFTPVSRIGYLPFLLLVNSQTPVKTLQELVAYAKATPAKANYAYTSSTGQIAAAALSNYTDMKAVGVAYKSAPEAVTSTLGGQVLFTILDFATTKGAVSAGRLRPLAVTPKERTSLAPELPTISEATHLQNFDLVAWIGLFGPANLPGPITSRLHSELGKIMEAPDIKARLLALGTEPAVADPAAFGDFVKAQLSVWAEYSRIAGVEPQ